MQLIYSISRFFLHGQILFHLDNPDPLERETISIPNPKQSKNPAGLDSKIRILYTTAAVLSVKCLFWRLRMRLSL